MMALGTAKAQGSHRMALSLDLFRLQDNRVGGGGLPLSGKSQEEGVRTQSQQFLCWTELARPPGPPLPTHGSSPSLQGPVEDFHERSRRLPHDT